ncbi:PP2C family protein-serine/threonine phosphatase [Streptomyces sp. UH6]|uniref:PP2C family protein-serine/threonine phosphatase n=1 Tax=Streptomyces sp. UH6 TaxID=2748379 RepID=UPI0015D4E9BF|nr:PP2C family protein-serine/threonine phosphatase [Streptomyces sp. UH6]NYV74343.1 serine/threonine-protein phosphatase [Streptomyces sp. UH6]
MGEPRPPGRRGVDGSGSPSYGAERFRSSARYRLGRYLPFLLIVLTVLVDVVERDYRADRLLYAVPAIAASTWGAGTTVLIGVLAMGVAAGLETLRGLSFVPGTSGVLIVLAVVTAASAWAAHVRQDRESRLTTVSAVAEATQRAVLRPLPSRLGPVDLYLLYEASVAGAHVGGDFYKALRVRGGVRLMVGDVQGKGLPAVEVAELLLSSFRESAYTAPDLPAVAARLEFSMARYVERDPESDAAGRFATVLLAEIPDDRNTVRLLSCGHPPPVRQHGTGTRLVELPAPSLPINLAGLANDTHDVREVPFTPGDRLLLYTDGVSETRDAHGDFYPLEERMSGWANEPAAAVTALLKKDLTRFSGHGLDDDTAAVLMVRH